jgi:hypothetical protein
MLRAHACISVGLLLWRFVMVCSQLRADAAGTLATSNREYQTTSAVEAGYTSAGYTRLG